MDIGSLLEAQIRGWRYLQHDPGGVAWNWLGVCFACLVEDGDGEAPLYQYTDEELVDLFKGMPPIEWARVDTPIARAKLPAEPEVEDVEGQLKMEFE